MIQLPKSLETVKESFARLSGIGEKSAMRLALQLVDWAPSERGQVANSLNDLSKLKRCQECFVYSDNNLCQICSSSKRIEFKSICVVENINDLLAIERSEQYYGLYHVLGGVLNPLMGVGTEHLEIESLVRRVARLGIESIILALNPSVEGDATCSYIKGRLGVQIIVERIGFGLPMGGSLEYVDAMTISKALENKRDF